MTALDIFTYADQQVRTVVIDGEPWFVGKDVCDVLGITKYRDALGQLDTDERVSVAVDTLGGVQQMVAVSEAGVLSLALISRSPRVKPFMRWLTHDVVPSIMRTGTYSTTPTPDLTSPAGILALAEQFTETARQLVAVTERAEVAESFKDAIVTSEGLSVREFHKHYFPDVSETAFNDMLYSRNLLIDQRGQRRDKNNKPIPGKAHRHPTWSGKKFFYLHPTVDRFGDRHETTRVRPGDAEIALAEYARKHLSAVMA
jgi:prophage antirepressor-like protein